MKRSHGNARARVSERIVLPRVQDVLEMLKRLWATKATRGDVGANDQRDNFEFFLIDLADAFCHFGVRKEELRHCISADEEERDALVWRAMLFGYKAAPLLMGRLSAAVGRLLASVCDPQLTALQVYIDDLIIVSLGCRPWRETRFGGLLYTAAAFGVQVSLKKGERGRLVKWIGCTFELPEVSPNEEEMVAVITSQQMVEQTRQTLKQWVGKGMAPVRELQTLTGRMSWLAGFLPRVKWTVNVLYAVLKRC